MPSGSRPGERRGGRVKGVPNRITLGKARIYLKPGLVITAAPLEYQPAKLAAIEGRYDTVQPTPLTLVRYFDALSYDFFG